VASLDGHAPALAKPNAQPFDLLALGAAAYVQAS